MKEVPGVLFISQKHCMKKRDKHVAGILALFFGWLGVHRYYLGENDRGFMYTIGSGIMLWGGRIPLLGLLFKFLWIPLILLISIIDAITFFAMEQKTFDEKYNGIPRTSRTTTREDRHRERKEQREARRRPDRSEPKARRSAAGRNNPYKRSGIEKFKDFDYAGAIGDFKKSLDLAPNDIATHFNLACAYSLTEKKDLAFHHLDLAVTHGFKDFEKIRNHHGLAYLRIQPEFEDFEENGYRLRQRSSSAQTAEPDILSTQPDLLDQLKKLGDLRKSGLLTELEFEQQKKKLLG